MEKPNPEAIRTAHSLVPGSGTAGPSTALRSGRDDKFEGGGPTLAWAEVTQSLFHRRW
jgi:hypothetical protein